MRRVATTIALAGLLCCTASAAAAPVDVKSAHLGLRAYRAYLSSTVGNLDAAIKGDNAFIGGIAAKCPNVLSNLNSLPEDQVNQDVLTQFGKEIGADLVLAALAPYQKPLATLTHRVERLRWSSGARKRSIKRDLAAQRAIYELPPSDLCADASALAANNGQSLPSGTGFFLTTYEKTARAAGLASLQSSLRRFHSKRDNKLYRTVRRSAIRGGNKLEGVVNSKLRTILGALGLKV
jgi:hypothetical protein